MYVESYIWKAGILPIDRTKYMTTEYSKLIKEYAENVTGNNVAVVCAGGPAIHHSDSRNMEGIPKESVVIKTQLGFNVMNVVKLFKNANVNYVSVNANTCASSMHCLYEANKLLADGYDKVIVVALEMTEPSQLKLFDQLGVNVKCGDGIGVLVLNTTNGIAKIDEVVWKWNNDRSPMSVSKEGYLKVLNSLDLSEVAIVKPHGTGTDRNDQAENEALAEVSLDKVVHKMYKPIVGHTQGASTAVELGMLLDELDTGVKAVVLASGMGGYYGGCTLWKCQ